MFATVNGPAAGFLFLGLAAIIVLVVTLLRPPDPPDDSGWSF